MLRGKLVLLDLIFGVRIGEGVVETVEVRLGVRGIVFLCVIFGYLWGFKR